MKRPTDASTNVATAYVREMLELNPMFESSDILRRRRELWTGTSSGGRPSAVAAPVVSPNGDPQADQRLRTRAKRYLDVLQTEFYQLPTDKLRQYITFLQNKRLPEFAAIAKRMRQVASQRSVLMRVARETGDDKFAHSLQYSLILPAAQAGALREQYIEAIVQERRVKRAGKMIRKFVDRHPKIYQLERDWFDLLLDRSNQSNWAAKYSMLSRGRSTQNRDRTSHPAWHTIVILLVVIVPGVFRLSRHLSDPTKPATSPAPTTAAPSYHVPNQAYSPESTPDAIRAARDDLRGFSNATQSESLADMIERMERESQERERRRTEARAVMREQHERSMRKMKTRIEEIREDALRGFESSPGPSMPKVPGSNIPRSTIPSAKDLMPKIPKPSVPMPGRRPVGPSGGAFGNGGFQ